MKQPRLILRSYTEPEVQNQSSEEAPAWDLSAMYKDQLEIESEIKQIKSICSYIHEEAKNLISFTAVDLRKLLIQFEKFNEYIDKLCDYADAKMAEDKSNPENQSMDLKRLDLREMQLKESSWFYEQLEDLPNETKFLLIQDTNLKGYPEWLFSVFWPIDEVSYLERNSQNVLEQQILNWSSLYEQVFTNFSVKIGDEERTYAQAVKLQYDKDENLATSARKALHAQLMKHGNIFSTALMNLHKSANKKAEIYIGGEDEYETADAFDINAMSNGVSMSVLNSMSDCIMDKGYQLSREFYNLLRQMLKKDQLSYFDRVKNPAESGKVEISWERAKNLILSLTWMFHQTNIPQKSTDQQPLLDFAKKAFEDKLIFAKDSPAAETGAHCSNTYPFRIFAPGYDNTVGALATLFHEYGHFLHHNVMYYHTTPLLYGASIAKSEICSIFWENLMYRALLEQEELKPIERLYLLIEYASHNVSSIQRQMAFHQFEKTVFNRVRYCGGISTDQLCEIFAEKVRDYTGFLPEKEAWSEWMRISHFYGFRPFYVQYYSFSTLIANRLLSKFMADPTDADFASSYYEFMKLSPFGSFEELLKEPFGINIYDAETWYSGLRPLEETIMEIKQLSKELDLL